ncbi:MAG TPA: aldose epimerase [Opitutaceae bacterium]|nr:aldose epimerase [Opitutaceae bacterium]
MEKVSYQGQSLTRWRVGQSTFLALPEKGARLMNWNLTLGDGTVRDVIYWPEVATFDDIAKVRGGNPILFPFCGRSFDAGEIHFWRDPAGVRRPMPIHGIARQGDFAVIRADDHGFAARFLPGEEARACYPFEHEFTVTYRFESAGLSCELALKNLGPAPIPWSAGHHFYFTVPWSEGATRQDYLIRLPASKRLKQDFKTGGLVPGPALGARESLANPDLIDTQHTGLQSSDCTFGEKDRPGDVTVRLGTAKVPPPEAAFVTWTADESAPFYCVEPWMGPPNAPETKVGLHWVPPGKTQTFVVSVGVK